MRRRDNRRLLQSASLTDLRHFACLSSRNVGGKLHALKEGAFRYKIPSGENEFFFTEQ